MYHYGAEPFKIFLLPISDIMPATCEKENREKKGKIAEENIK